MGNNENRILQKFLRNRILSYRMEHLLTQEQMAERLHVSTRSYIDQEHSKYGFSTLSFIYYVLLLSDENIIRLFEQIKVVLENHDKE